MAAQVWDVMLATCPSRTSLARIANKWTAMIVIALSERRMRFGDLRTTVAGISGKVLTDTLRDLERDGIVTRHAYAEIPPRVEYELTNVGRELRPVITAMERWGRRWDERSKATRWPPRKRKGRSVRA